MYTCVFTMQTSLQSSRVNKRVNFSYGIRQELNIPMEDLSESRVQSTFLHSEALVARHELMDLLCEELKLPRNRVTYSRMCYLGWYFGQKLIRQDGKIFWATDTRYPYGGLRRDNLRIAGSEVTGTGRNKRVSALCCQAVLFLTVTNLSTLRTSTSTISNNTMTFVLGRWFRPHETVRLRDGDNLPICPGPLQTNHCLWKHALSERPREALATKNNPDRPCAAFERQKRLFGVDRDEQLARFELDKHAYYCLLTTDTIIDTMNMCPEFIADTHKPDYTRWLQSVTLI